MKKTLLAALAIAAHFPVQHVQAAEPPKLTQQQKQELLGEVIGVGIAGAVLGAALNEQNHHHNQQPNGWNNNNNWNNNSNNDNWNNNTGNNTGGRRYDYIPPSSARQQSAPVYRETYPAQPQRVYSQQPVYSSTIEGERIISSSPVITNERVISSSPTVSSERVTSSKSVKENSLPYKGPGVNIRLTTDTGGSVAYIIDGVEEGSIEAGQEQTLTKKGKYEIRFSRGRSPEGTDFGQARYTISEGNYVFEVTEKGWDLLRDKNSQPTASTTPSQSGIKTNALPSKAAAPSAPGSVLVAAPHTAAPAETSGAATPTAP